MAGRALLIAALFPLAFAFSDTAPLVAWSSHSSNLLDRLPSTLSESSNILENLLYNDDICDQDAVIFVEQPSLHASDLRTLSPSSKLAEVIALAPSSRQYPYARSMSSSQVVSLAETISARCQSELVRTPPHGSTVYNSKSKHVVCVHMPKLTGAGATRKDSMKEHGSRLSEELKSIASAFPKHIVIFTGSASSLSKRDRDSSLSSILQGPGNSTLPDESSGILHRYQLLTPGLILTLLLTFFLLIPIVLAGVSALSSIQSPLRADAPKGFSARDKKNS